MNRLLAFIGFLVVATGIYFAFIYEPCTQPDESVQATAYLKCALTFTPTDMALLRERVCQKLGRQSQCEIIDSDKEVVEESLNEFMTECAKQTLKENKFCTDKLKSLKDL